VRRCIVRRTREGGWSDDWAIFDAAHINWLFAGGGRWIAGESGVQTWIDGVRQPSYLGCLGMEQDGAYILKGPSTSEQPVVTFADGTRHRYDGLVDPRVRGDLVMGREGDRVVVYRRDRKLAIQTHPHRPQWTGVAFEDPVGELWLWYAVESPIGVILHHADDPTRGYRFPGGVWSPDVAFDGVICHPAWASGDGEALGVIQTLTLTLYCHQ
jgi:hypothetical protein